MAILNRDKNFLRQALLVVIWLCAVGSVQAQQPFISAMGFRSVVPEGWISLTQDEVGKNAKLFDGGLAAMKGANPELLKQVEAEIRGGRIELLFAPMTDPAFRDNINVRQTALVFPSNEQAMQTVCQSMPAQLQQMIGRPIRVYSCRIQNLPVGKVSYFDFDGAVAGTRSVQYNVPSKTGTSIQITGTFTNVSLEKQRPLLEGFIRSMKLN